MTRGDFEQCLNSKVHRKLQNKKQSEHVPLKKTNNRGGIRCHKRHPLLNCHALCRNWEKRKSPNTSS